MPQKSSTMQVTTTSNEKEGGNSINKKSFKIELPQMKEGNQEIQNQTFGVDMSKNLLKGQGILKNNINEKVISGWEQ